MTTSYLPYHPQQDLLLPSSLQEWLPEGHLAYYISDTVDQLNLSAFHERYAKGGPRNQPFHPAMMVKVLLYAYATGVFSSRKIARKLHEDVAFRVLGAGNFPAHRTLCDFRAVHLPELSELFVQVVKLARECGLVKLGTLAVDGTKLKGNASRHKAMSYGRMRQAEVELQQQIKELLAKARAVDAAEQSEPELDLPGEITRRQQRLAVIQAAKARLEERQRAADAERGRSAEDERRPHDKDGKPGPGRPYKRDFGVPQDEAQENFTDPQSRLMKRTGGGFDYGYNAQAAIDAYAHIVVAAELSNHANDHAELPVMLAAVQANLQAVPQQVLADAGYRSEAVLKELQEWPTDLLVALGREGNSEVKLDAQKYPLSTAMAAKMQSPAGAAAYRRRKCLAEPPYGWIKNVLGFRQFSFRGLRKVAAEWKLVCLALNLRRMNGLQVT